MFQRLILIAIATLPALLPLLLVSLYFRRFSERKLLIVRLLTGTGDGRSLRRETNVRREQWKTKLDLDLPAYFYPTGIAAGLTTIGTLMILARDPGQASPLPNV